MPREIFKAIKEKVMASNAYGREMGRRSIAFESARRDEPRASDAWPQPSQPQPSQAAAAPQAPTPTESAPVNHVLSVIGPSLVFRGTLVAEEDLLVQGRVEGSINHNGSNLTIGTHGEVQADISARKVIIQGAVYGDVRASEAIVVEASARVQGNLLAPRVALKEGAKFKGAIDMDLEGTEESASPSDRKPRAERGEVDSGKVDELLERSSS